MEIYLTVLATIATIALVGIALSVHNIGYFFNPRLLEIWGELNKISDRLEQKNNKSFHDDE